MKKTIATFMAALCALGSALAGEAKPVKYTATMTGVVCSACKKTVRSSLEKIGASKIEFARGDKEGQQKVTFLAASEKLTKEDTAKALGDAAEEYQVLTLVKNP